MEVIKHGRHPRLIKQIYRVDSDQYGGRRVQENRYTNSETLEKKKDNLKVFSDKVSTNHDYQIIYKSANTDEPLSKKQKKSLQNNEKEENNVKVEPRGSSTGFSKRKELETSLPV